MLKFRTTPYDLYYLSQTLEPSQKDTLRITREIIQHPDWCAPNMVKCPLNSTTYSSIVTSARRIDLSHCAYYYDNVFTLPT